MSCALSLSRAMVALVRTLLVTCLVMMLGCRDVVAERFAAPAPLTIDEPDPPPPTEFTAADFAGGDAYPGPVTVDLADMVIAPGAREVFVDAVLSAPSPNTVIAFVRCRRGQGWTGVPDRTRAVIFRPGDPLRASVRCPVSRVSAGDSVLFEQIAEPDGARRGDERAYAMVADGRSSVPTPPKAFRPPYRFRPKGRLSYAAQGASMLIGDKGGPGQWSTALFHGRVQPANGETGYYGRLTDGAFGRAGDALILNTKRLPHPIIGEDGHAYPHLAAALSAHAMPAATFRFGSVEWVVKMPDRRGSWPALWLLPGSARWPPEIDVYEGFGENAEWTFASDLSTNLHGGADGHRRFTRGAHRMRMSDFGLPNTLTSDFHRFQVTVDAQWITMFVDDVETMRYANPFAGRDWYPVMTVAVKTTRGGAYEDGSGAMALRSIKVWRNK